ncbi:MAG: alpha/beta hydrolase [Acidimicrobiales bacterium]|nr:alpha/beta hydrolase [Acidimicrobiales bacterium]
MGGPMQPYDEFSMLVDNVAEAGLDVDAPPPVERIEVRGPDGLVVSAIRWGTGLPELVLLHGGAQNAHTWDTVALALRRPLLAIDLPGHGHSDWRPQKDYTPQVLAVEIARVVEAHAPEAEAVIGMSLGGLTALCLATDRPDLVRRLGLVDITPGTDHAKAEPIIAFVTAHQDFADFDAILAHTMEHNPTRTESSLRRGVLHNACEQEDGSWSWRWDPVREWKVGEGPQEKAPDFGALWDRVSSLEGPVHLWLGGAWSVVGDEDVEEFRRRQPGASVTTVDGAGHSIQGDRPLETVDLIEGLLAEPA